MVRSAGPRAIVEVAHTDLPAARSAWNGPLSDPSGRVRWTVKTLHTWGTLRLAKVWLVRSQAAAP